MNKRAIYNSILPLLGILTPFMLVLFTHFGYADKKVLVYFILAIIILSVLRLLKNRFIYLSFLLFCTLFYSIISFIDVSHLLIFKSLIRTNTMYILLESNKNETFEFITMYLFRPKILFVGGIYLLSIITGFMFSYIRFDYNKKSKEFQKDKFSMICVGLIICFIVLLKYRNDLLPYSILTSLSQFQMEREEISKIKIKKDGDFNDLHRNKNLMDERETYVVIIGESTTRTHMGIYGYNRNTTPLLSNRKDELFVYRHVRSPHTHTITSLTKTLTLGNLADKQSSTFNNTLIQLFNGIDFTTSFISNQKPIGQWETTMTLISKTSDKSIFTNVAAAAYDQEIIKPLQQILKQESRKKFIMIHLMGTHLQYANRYPPKYNLFKEKPITKFNHELAYKTINEYDNAVLYNDYIVNSIIDEVEKHNSKSYVLYFSDHGEDVFETIDESCHTETKGTDPMYKIPFVLWCSSDYLSNKQNLVWDLNRKYNNEDLIHTVADLSDIKFRRFESAKSIVNSNFEEK